MEVVLLFHPSVSFYSRFHDFMETFSFVIPETFLPILSKKWRNINTPSKLDTGIFVVLQELRQSTQTDQVSTYRLLITWFYWFYYGFSLSYYKWRWKPWRVRDGESILPFCSLPTYILRMSTRQDLPAYIIRASVFTKEIWSHGCISVYADCWLVCIVMLLPGWQGHRRGVMGGTKRDKKPDGIRNVTTDWAKEENASERRKERRIVCSLLSQKCSP